ncbi:hypothetical protein MASR1M36_19290 [Candidatus Cloacimonadaceae bacterium]
MAEWESLPSGRDNRKLPTENAENTEEMPTEDTEDAESERMYDDWIQKKVREGKTDDL